MIAVALSARHVQTSEAFAALARAHERERLDSFPQAFLRRIQHIGSTHVDALPPIIPCRPSDSLSVDDDAGVEAINAGWQETLGARIDGSAIAPILAAILHARPNAATTREWFNFEDDPDEYYG